MFALFRFISLLLLLGAIDYYSWQSVRSTGWANSTVRYIYWGISGIVALALLVLTVVGWGGNTRLTYQVGMFVFGLVVVLYVPKVLICMVMLLEEISRLAKLFYLKFFSADVPGSDIQITRSVFLHRLLVLLAAIPFGSILYGIWRGRYDYKVHSIDFAVPHLPDDFEGYTIVQISDVHAGSFDNHAAVAKGIALIQAQKPDLIVFTGDLVNSLAEEIEPFIELFKGLEAKDGKFSVLGNHDYGDYALWANITEKQENLRKLKAHHAAMGFRLLLNEHVRIRRNQSEFALLGVENWGTPPFPQKGDIEAALSDTAATDFRLLLSHDPSHWDVIVSQHPQRIDLTLSGHTHGMQFGIEIGGWKWSPIKLRYPHWAGLYQHNDRYLYVNRGFGFLGFPGRVGIWPEITKIVLRKGSATAGENAFS